jgi:hypothetical protein
MLWWCHVTGAAGLGTQMRSLAVYGCVIPLVLVVVQVWLVVMYKASLSWLV